MPNTGILVGEEQGAFGCFFLHALQEVRPEGGRGQKSPGLSRRAVWSIPELAPPAGQAEPEVKKPSAAWQMAWTECGE